VLGYLFFGDVVQFWTLVGAAVICGVGLALLLLEREAARRGREAKDIETPVLPEA
jgi:drug/metabolite transporter (DMT)-like permease